MYVPAPFFVNYKVIYKIKEFRFHLLSEDIY